jgi:predicted alpha/beta-hydrolase family hydrolase
VTAGRTPTPEAGAAPVGDGPSGGRPSASPTEDLRATPAAPVVREVATAHGPARVTVHPVPQARAVLLLGHGAGGGFAAPDLRAATSAAQAAGLHVAHVEQPYRVAGRRAPAPAAQLDTAWTTVVAAVRAALPGLPLLVGGRSSGARVACRTASATGALAVVCLAFPVHPPGRPEKDRLPELAAPTVPVLVVQGDRDPFGRPPPAPGREVVLVTGDHTLKADLPGLTTAVTTWLDVVLAAARPPR